MASSIRVLMITSEWPVPGMSRTAHFIKRQADFLTAAGVDVDVFPFKGAKNPINYMKAWVRLRRKLKGARYDLVHAQFGRAIAGATQTPAYGRDVRGSDLLGTVSDRRGHYMKQASPSSPEPVVAKNADGSSSFRAHESYLPPSIKAHVIPPALFSVFRSIPKEEAASVSACRAMKKLVLFGRRPTQARKSFYLSKQAVEVLIKGCGEVDRRLGCSSYGYSFLLNACDRSVSTPLQEGGPRRERSPGLQPSCRVRGGSVMWL